MKLEIDVHIYVCTIIDNEYTFMDGLKCWTIIVIFLV